MSANTLTLMPQEEGEMTKSEVERIAVLEAQVGHIKETLDRVVSLEAQVVRLAQAQEARNELRDREHVEGREDMRDFWTWFRWGVDRAVPLVALLLAAYIITQGGGR